MGEMIRHDTGNAARPTRTVGPAPGHYRSAERPGLPVAWWRGNPRYTVYMLRELSSVFLALWAVLFLAQLQRLRRGQEAYELFIKGQARPLWVAFHLTAFAFALLHSVTWLQLAGVVQTVRLRGRTMDPRTVTAAAFGGWAATSLGVLAALLLAGRKAKG